MRLGPQISPLRPIFRERKRFGSVEVGNTPSTPINTLPPYDNLVLNVFGGLFYLKPVPKEPYTAWETRDEMYDGDLSSTSEKGPIYFRAWFAESGNAPTDWDDAFDDYPYDGMFLIRPEP
jgi:hypothetical protein